MGWEAQDCRSERLGGIWTWAKEAAGKAAVKAVPECLHLDLLDVAWP